MNKEELIKLKEDLIASKMKQYRDALIESSDGELINIEFLGEKSFAKVDILNKDTHENELIQYIEDSLESIIRSSVERGIDFDALQVELGMYVFIPEKIALKIEREGLSSILKSEFNQNELLYSRQKVFAYFDFIGKDSENFAAEDLTDQKLLYGNYFVNYDKLVTMLAERGFEVSAKTVNAFLNMILNGQKNKIVVDFKKNQNKSIK